MASPCPVVSGSTPDSARLLLVRGRVWGDGSRGRRRVFLSLPSSWLGPGFPGGGPWMPTDHSFQARGEEERDEVFRLWSQTGCIHVSTLSSLLVLRPRPSYVFFSEL